MNNPFSFHRSTGVLSIALGMIVLIAASCAMPAEGERTRTNYNLLTAEEIAAVDASTLFDVVERLRPRWIRQRGAAGMHGAEGGIYVYQGNSIMGDLDVLRQFSPGMVTRLRYMDGPTASNTLPRAPAHIQGAIIIEFDR